MKVDKNKNTLTLKEDKGGTAYCPTQLHGVSV